MKDWFECNIITLIKAVFSKHSTYQHKIVLLKFYVIAFLLVLKYFCLLKSQKMFC